MTDNKRRMPSDAKSPHCLWQGELKRILKCEYLYVMHSINLLHYIIIGLFLREIMARVIFLLTVYYNGVFFLEMNQSETRIACGGHVC
jgi:hypothetical protein